MEVETRRQYLRRIASVDQALEAPGIKQLMKSYSRGLVVESVREAIDELRSSILEAGSEAALKRIPLEGKALVGPVRQRIEALYASNLKTVINATGVIVHTNLGRSILSDEAVAEVEMVARHYSNLEFDIPNGRRGSRHVHVEKLLVKLSGAEAGMVVNNNAAAVLLALSALARRKETIISRGQLVEIGGAFRIPDVMSQSGSKLREVGATNKTRLADYRDAISDKTGLLLKVHPSNFQMLGFTQEVTLEELVALGAEFGLPVMEDLGSGVLVDLSDFGLPYEPTVQLSVQSGADVITFSGDKLLGGPQAGVIVGKKLYIDKLKKHPLARAVRVDKMTLAALEATFRGYLNPSIALKENPTLRMMVATKEQMAKKASALAKAIEKAAGEAFEVTCEDEVSRAGGGALPLAELPTVVVALKPTRMSVDALEARLRGSAPAIIARVKEDRLLLDPRTIQDGEDKQIVEALTKAAL